MKAFLSRLGRGGRDKEKPPPPALDLPRSEKPPTVLPDLPSAFKAGDFFSSATPTTEIPPTTPQSRHSQQRPPSQFDKPLPEIVPTPRQPPADGSPRQRKPREPSQSTATSSRNLDSSQGRSTVSKQSASTHMNSVSTDETSITGGSSGGATATQQNQQQQANAGAGGGGGKKVAFISPPPTPGGLSITAPLPDMVTDLSVEADIAGTANGSGGGAPGRAVSPLPSSSSKHGHSQSLSRVTSLPNAPPTTTTNSSSANAASSASARRSSTNLPSKLDTSTSTKGSPKSTSKTASSPSYAARQFASGAGSRTQSRAEFAQSTVSFRSGTPYSHMSSRTTTIQLPSSWSEAAEEDLVSNLGPRERTRQEVLWEIVTSEQRYVNDLIKLKETFIDPLLHPYASTSPPFSSPSQEEYFTGRAGSPTESIEHLPIASRFLTSPTPDNQPQRSGVAGVGAVGYARQRTASEGRRNANATSDEDDGDESGDRMGSMPYLGGLKGVFKDRVRTGSGASKSSGKSPYKDRTSTARSRSHQSLPPPARDATLSHQSLVEGMESLREGGGRAATAMSTRTGKYPEGSTPASRMFQRSNKLHKAVILDMPIGAGGMMEGLGLEKLAVAPHMLPEDLRICLEVLEKSLKGHIALCDGLRQRYEDQYPLVRSLADVFIANASVLEGYATYVLHLERALEQVDNALLNQSTKRPKNQDAADWAKVCKLLKRLEEIAADKGETGLAISLSKPFQRLLKYPLMFQNLLFHTDPSTFEYESTLSMVAGVERIVRSIEDEKIQKEERDVTRDIFARIDGLEKVKMLAVPKPSRVLVEEKQVSGADLMSSSDGASSRAGVKTKSSFKRLSDVLPSGTPGKNGVGGKNDLWLVRFNDVVLRCQRTGTTTLPLATGLPASRSNSLPAFPEGAGKAKYATTGRRHSQMKPRNLYKFVKIETWVIGNVNKPKVGMVSMEDIGRSRSGVVAIEPVKSGDTDDENGNDSDDSDRKSKMSFSYWGADKITVDPVASAKARAAAQKPSTTGGASGGSKRSSLAPVAYTRSESHARAKFGNRLRGSEADDDVPVSLRSTRRTAGGTTSSRRTATEEGGGTGTASAPGGTRKPAWNSRTMGAGGGGSSAASASPARRVHNQSITSTNSAAAAAISRTKAASPAPTEDSGLAWVDPSVHRLQ